MADYISSLTGPQMDSALEDMAEHNSEAWAVGTRAGIDVDPEDEAYENNAKYYSDLSGECSETAVENAITSERASAMAETYYEYAQASATAAQNAATTAQSYTNNPPKPNNNEKWELWNGTAYVESTYPSRGPAGATGPAAGFGSPNATIDGNTGTPSVTITASGPDSAKVFAFDFRNLKGEQGAPGSGYITVDGVQYEIRTGTSGAAGYITFEVEE